MTKRSQGGYTITEILISVAILGVVFLLGLELYRMGLEQNKSAEVNLALEAISKIARQKVRFPDTCSGSGASLSFTEPFSIADANGIDSRLLLEDTPPVALVQGASNVYGLNVLSLKLSNIVPVDIASLPRKYSGLLKLTAEKTENVAGGKGLRPRVLAAVMLETDASGNFLRCYFSEPSTVTCASLGGVYDVNQDPACQLPFNLTGCSSANEFLTGFVNGVPQCQSFDGACPAGKYVIGLSATGVVCSI